MKKIQILILLIFSINHLFAQGGDEKSFDFWIGEWNLSWDEGDGKMGKGINRIHYIMDSKVIQENFEATEGKNKGYKGTSLSVYNPAKATWNQAWTDNQGGYISFSGEINGDKKIFKTQMKSSNGQQTQQRMIFYDFKEDRFTWDWEGTNDGGNSWNLLWRINYQKIK